MKAKRWSLHTYTPNSQRLETKRWRSEGKKTKISWCARYAREKRTCLFKNSTTSSSNSPLFERKQTLPQPSLRSTEPYTCPLVGFSHQSGKKNLTTQRKGQSYEALNLFRTRGGNRIFHRPIHSTHTKKRGVVRVFTFFVLSFRFICRNSDGFLLSWQR